MGLVRGRKIGGGVGQGGGRAAVCEKASVNVVYAVVAASIPDAVCTLWLRPYNQGDTADIYDNPPVWPAMALLGRW